MSIIGQSFSGDSTNGALVSFDVGNAADVFTGAFTVVCLAKSTNSNWGMLGGFSDSVGGSQQGGLFFSDNSGGRLYSNADFTNGYPDPGDDADGISDDVWRWHAVSKPAGSAHYRFHYADLATLTWAHGESASAANHGDQSTVVAFSTWAVYAMGFNSGDMAAIAVFTRELSDAAIEAALTQLATDLAVSSPAAGWLFPEATAGSAVADFTGGGADETGRQFIATSDDPADFDFTLGTESVFTTQTPSLADQNDGGAAGITTATTLTFAAAGEVIGIRFYATATVGVGETYTAELWSVTNNTTGSLLASKAVDSSTITSGTWNVIEFDSPVAVDDATAYRAAIHNDHNQGRYVATPGFFTSAGVTNGNITAIQASASPFGASLSNGTFSDSSAAGVYPANQFGEACYFVDVVYTLGAGSPDATVTPATIAAVASLPSAAKSTGSTVSPSAIAATAALPSGAVSTGSTVSPAVVAATAATPAAGVQTGTTVTPAVVAAVATLPAAHVVAGSATVYVRIGGASVQLALRGAVHLDGASIAFG